jgi:trafficking protein particle complex subunit 8
MKRTFGLHCCLVTLNAPASGSETNEINLQEWHEIFTKHSYKTEVLATQVERHAQALFGSSDDVAQNLPPPPQASSLNSTPILSYRSEAESAGVTPSSGAATPTTSSVSTPTGRMVEPHLQTPTSEDPLFHTETNQIPDIELGEAEVTEADTSQITQGQEQQVSEQLLQESSQIFSEADIVSLKSLVRQMVTQSLIPFMERSIQQWNEQVAAARRGLTGRFLGASRRLFGNANVRGSPGPQSLQAIPAFGPNVSPATPTTNMSVKTCTFRAAS